MRRTALLQQTRSCVFPRRFERRSRVSLEAMLARRRHNADCRTWAGGLPESA